ncbi:MAG: ATP-dependent DNA helicase [Calditrichaceae bacterium]|nr:ATP-dependent DNA helicase [Calditrichaceae bacterium]
MAIKIEDNRISLNVRDLVFQSRPPQMLSSFPLPQRGMLGRQAQTKIQTTKNKRFGLLHSEYVVHREYPYKDYVFDVQGRIDGVYQLKNRVEIEEIKSVILSASEFKSIHPELFPEFSEQLLFYAYLLQDELKGIEVVTYLIIVNLVNDASRSFSISYNRMAIENLLMQRFESITAGIERDKMEKQRRQAEISLIDFSMPEKRPQQQTMMDTVNQVLNDKMHLLVSAPTGTGKTAASLYPAIHYAYANQKKIFFVTSKTTQQNIVQETVLPLAEQGFDFKVLYLRAAEKMCANDVYFCHEAHCPYAKDYHDRLLESNIISELLQNSILQPDAIYAKAVEHILCPFEVSLDLSFHIDLLVGDFNYVFDPTVYLRRLFAKKDYSDWILIIDEAHNLYERGMQYLSPQLKKATVAGLINQNKDKKSKVFKVLTSALQEIHTILNELNLEGEIHFAGRRYFETDLNIQSWDSGLCLYEQAFIKYLIEKIKKRWLIIDDPLDGFYFNLRRFVQIARIQDRAFVPFYDADEGGILKIQCCDPSQYLQQRIEGFHSVIAMSATLDPIDFYQNVLGFPEYRTEKLQLDSPFPNEHRKIIVVPGVSTRYKDRMQNYPHIAQIIEEVIRQQQGNYLVFFPSFDFIQNVNVFLGKVKHNKILQKPGMKDEDRNLVLHELRKKDQQNLLLAVMGGIFSEGVDYFGDMAIGVIVISPALPLVSFERELLRQYYEEKQHAGMEYAYIFPGMNKVIQSVGRLIRSATDKGIVVLIGERFADDQFNNILPEYWFKRQGDIEITDDFIPVIKEFWERTRS